MKRPWSCAFLLFLALLIGSASWGGAEGPPDQDVRDFPTCQYCNMNRDVYAHSRVLILFTDGTQFGACSIHCAALNLTVQSTKVPLTILVADYASDHLINGEYAWWVIGGSKPGVMTKRAKWAFQKKADAESFVTENGGRLASFDEVMQAAYDDMYADTKMIRIKKKIGKMNPY